MKAKTLTQLITLFNPQQHLDETQHHFFVNIFGKELDRFVTEIVHAPTNQIFFITGQSGNGKTSMLRNLQTEYPEELKSFHFFYLEGRDLLNLEHLKIEDVIYKIATKLMPTEAIVRGSLSIDTLNEMIKRYEDEVLEGKKRLVLVIDDFEKLVIADLNKTDDVYYKFLFEGIPSLKYLNCIKLVTFPFHFKNSAIIEDARFKDFIIHLDTTGSIDVPSIQEVILKRLDDTTLISELPFLISFSGANMRQLIQIVHQAGLESKTAKGTKIDKSDMLGAIGRLRKEFRELIERDLEFYKYVHKYNEIDFKDEKHQALLTSALRNRTVFAYLFDSSYYYALNPVVVKLLEGRGRARFLSVDY